MAKDKTKEMLEIFDNEYKKYLSNVVSKIQKQTSANFKKEKNVDGEAFAPLKNFTINEKKELGFGNKRILERTGALERSIKFSYDHSKYEIKVDSVSYAEELNDGRAKKPAMKPRRITELPKNWKSGGKDRVKLLNNFTDTLKQKLSKIINEM